MMLTGHLEANSLDPDQHQVQTACTESSESALHMQTKSNTIKMIIYIYALLVGI